MDGRSIICDAMTRTRTAFALSRARAHTHTHMHTQRHAYTRKRTQQNAKKDKKSKKKDAAKGPPLPTAPLATRQIKPKPAPLLRTAPPLLLIKSPTTSAQQPLNSLKQAPPPQTVAPPKLQLLNASAGGTVGLAPPKRYLPAGGVAAAADMLQDSQLKPQVNE